MWLSKNFANIVRCGLVLAGSTTICGSIELVPAGTVTRIATSLKLLTLNEASPRRAGGTSTRYSAFANAPGAIVASLSVLAEVKTTSQLTGGATNFALSCGGNG